MLALNVFIVCSEIPFSKNVCHMETGQLIWSADQLTGYGFHIIRVFSERYFRANIKLSSFFWGGDVLNLFLIIWIKRLSYMKSVRMSNEFIVIKKTTAKHNWGFYYSYTVYASERKPIKKNSEIVSLGLFLAFSYKTCPYKSVGAAIKRLSQIA